MKESLTDKALQFAERKHTGQKRKDLEGRPYIAHPLRVKEILETIGGVRDEVVLAAALLHDTLEDTETTSQDLEDEFGVQIASVVMELTDDKGLPKQERKEAQAKKASSLSPEASLVKIADKIANVEDVLFRPPAGWDKRRREEYVAWAARVVDGLLIDNPALSACFSVLRKKASEMLRC